MTTIAYKDGVLAADGQITTGTLIHALDYQKIHIVEKGTHFYRGQPQNTRKLLVGSVGDSCWGLRFRIWVEDGGAMGGTIPKPEDDKGWLGFTIAPDGNLQEYTHWGMIEYKTPNEMAWGSGREIAAGALIAGASAEEAVRIAAQKDTLTGGEITVLRLSDIQPTP